MALTREAVHDMVYKDAVRQGVDPILATRLAYQESRYNPDARSSAGARGTMQLMPGTAKQLGVDATDPLDNIRGGITYLKQQLDRFKGDPHLALAAYNAGPGAVLKHGGVPPFKETQQYVASILGEGDTPWSRLASSRQTAPVRDWWQAPAATGGEVAPLRVMPEADPTLEDGSGPDQASTTRQAQAPVSLLGDMPLPAETPERQPVAAWGSLVGDASTPGARRQGLDWSALLFG